MVLLRQTIQHSLVQAVGWWEIFSWNLSQYIILFISELLLIIINVNFFSVITSHVEIKTFNFTLWFETEPRRI